MPVSKRVKTASDADICPEDEYEFRDFKRAKPTPDGTAMGSVNDKEARSKEGGELVFVGSPGEAGPQSPDMVPFRFPMEVWAKVSWNRPLQGQAERLAHDGDPESSASPPPTLQIISYLAPCSLVRLAYSCKHFHALLTESEHADEIYWPSTCDPYMPYKFSWMGLLQWKRLMYVQTCMVKIPNTCAFYPLLQTSCMG